MKLHTTLILLLLFSIHTWIHAQNMTNEQGEKHGFWKGYYPSGKLKYDGTYKNGVSVGIFKYYHEGTEKVKMMVTHKGDGINSSVVIYDENGVKISEGYYRNQKKHGEWKFYTPDGILRVLENWSEGKREGFTYKYYENGNVLEQVEFKDDMRHGEWKQFYEDRVIKTSGTYVNNKLEGKARFYNSKGRVEIEGDYVDDFKEGTWLMMDKYGKVEKKLIYKRSILLNPEVLDRQEIKPIKVEGYE